MNYPLAIAVYVVWTALVIWAARRLGRTMGLSMLIVSGLALLPLPPRFEPGRIQIIKTAWVTLAASSVMLLMARQWKLRWPRWKWWDAFIVLWSVAQVASEIANAQSLSATAVIAAEQALQWLLPYFIGRVAFQHAGDFRDLARVLAWAGLALIPLTLIESLSGFYLQNIYQPALPLKYPAYPLILNLWGPENYRPGLFFEGTYMGAAFFFAAAALAQLFLVVGGNGALGKKKWDLAALFLLIAAVINCRVFMSQGIFLGGAVVALSLALFRTRVLLFILLLGLPAYAVARGAGHVTTHELMQNEYADTFQKKSSLWYRLYQEDTAMRLIREKNAQLLGLGGTAEGKQGGEGWRSNIYIDINFPSPKLGVDGRWTWTLLRNGWLGLLAAYLAIAVPLLAAAWHMPSLGRGRAGALPLTPFLALYTIVAFDLIDWTINPLESVVWALALGGLASAAATWHEEKNRGRRRQA